MLKSLQDIYNFNMKVREIFKVNEEYWQVKMRNIKKIHYLKCAITYLFTS